MKNYITNTLASCFLILTLFSCNQDQPVTLEAPKMSKAALVQVRAVKKKVAAKAYYYRSLASFVNGTLTSTIMNDYDHDLQQVNLVVLYEANASWAEVFEIEQHTPIADKNIFHKLLQSYQLQIVKQFSIDQNNKGLVLEFTEQFDNPVETARCLSMLEHVLMVNIKEIPNPTQKNK